MDINDIVKWYNNNTNISINHELIEYMIKNNVINELDKNAIDEFLLLKVNNSYFINGEKYEVKKNRINFIKKMQKNIDKKINKFKLNLKNKNNIKLIKIN